MFQKLFNIAVVILFVVVSLAILGFLFRGIFWTLTSPLMTDSSGISAVSGGVSEKWLRIALVLTVLIGGGYLYLRGRRKSRER